MHELTLPSSSSENSGPSMVRSHRFTDGGDLAFGRWLAVGFFGCWVVFVPFSTIWLSFLSFNDDLGTMPTRRPYSWKKKRAQTLAAMLFVREFKPIDGQQSSFHLFHLSTEEGGDSPLGCGWRLFPKAPAKGFSLSTAASFIFLNLFLLLHLPHSLFLTLFLLLHLPHSLFLTLFILLHLPYFIFFTNFLLLHPHNIII